MAPDPFDLQRFIDAQNPLFDDVLRELSAGRKTSHWMWFVFPQFAGLASSATSVHYAIKSVAEAKAYLAHPVLGRRLTECAEILLNLPDCSAHDVFGSPDDLKLKSSMTLFVHVSPPGSVFERVLHHYFANGPDARTLELLKMGS